MDAHNYLPILELGKRPECVKCTITGKNNVHENKSPNNQFVHSVRNDFKYVTPILRKEAMEAGTIFKISRIKRNSFSYVFQFHKKI